MNRFGILGFLSLAFCMVGLSCGVIPEGGGTDEGRFFKKTDGTGMKILKGVGLVVGSGVALLTGGFLLGYGQQKGMNIANRTPMPGEASNDESMTTAQAGARGGRQRAA